MKKLFCYIYISFLLLFSTDFAQNFFANKYGDEHGLRSNLTKSLDQDKNGFLWVATDAGLARFDGKQFINITKNLPSPFVKDVLITSENKLIIVTDLGVGFVNIEKDDYQYTPLIEGKPEEREGFLYYPKAAFEDSRKNIWISDNTGLTKLNNGKYKKYRFEDKFATDDYLNSFWITEDNSGRLFASSWQGYLFFFDEKADKFVEIPIINKKDRIFINQLAFINDYIVAATSKGLVKFTIKDNLTSEMSLMLPFVNAICFYVDYDKYLIGGVEGGIFEWNGKSDKAIPILGNNVKSVVNYIYTDNQNNIWACTDEGIVLFQKTFFSEFRLSKSAFDNAKYIRTLCSDGLGNIFFTDQENIYKVKNEQYNQPPEIAFNSKGKRIYNFVIKNDKMWISTRNNELIFKSDNVTKNFSIPGFNYRISGMCIDSSYALWGLIENTNKVLKVNSDFSYKIYDLTKYTSSESLIKCIDNNIFILSFVKDINILLYDNKKDLFVQNKLKNTINYNTNVTINDFVKLSRDYYVIASNIGVLKYQSGVISYQFGEDHLLTINAKAIASSSNNELWIGTENGLVLYYVNEFVVFNRVDGLPNTVITPSGLFLDNNNKLWVATSSGLAFWQKNDSHINKTPKPVISSAIFKGKHLDIKENYFDVSGKGTLIFNYSALVYPANKRYQFRLLGWQDEWSELTEFESQSFINLPAGNYILEVRAKQFDFLWSDITQIKFTISPPWYLTDTLIIFYFLIGILLIIYGTLFIQKNRLERLEKQKEVLQKLVDEKVKDLKKEKEITERLLLETESYNKELERVNSELLKANEFKSDILGIAAHDLKNPLSTIINLTELIKDDEIPREDKQEMVNLINNSAMRMLNLIADLLENIMVENTKFRINLTKINITEIVAAVVTENKVQASKKGQTIFFDYSEICFIEGDAKWIREILDNIINNAVKYTPYKKNIFVEVRQTEEKVIVKIKDEGPGFTEQDKAQLFQKFRRLSARPTGGENSTGLGLAIVKELIELHKGEITLLSDSGMGAQFIISFRKKIN